MKKALAIIVAMFLLLLAGCTPAAEAEPSLLPIEEITDPPADKWTPPPVTPTPSPRTAEEVLPPVEKDIFAGRDDLVYTQLLGWICRTYCYPIRR